jgi:hypothetical protein
VSLVSYLGSEGDLLDVMEPMKPLIARIGAERIQRIADLLV